MPSDDIENCVANKIECVNAFGAKCIELLDPVALVVYWSAWTTLADPMGHSVDVLCSFCVFPRSKGLASATNVNKSKLQLRRTSLMRLDVRMYISQNLYVLTESCCNEIRLKSNCRQKKSAYFKICCHHNYIVAINSPFQENLLGTSQMCVTSIIFPVRLLPMSIFSVD